MITKEKKGEKKRRKFIGEKKTPFKIRIYIYKTNLYAITL